MTSTLSLWKATQRAIAKLHGSNQLQTVSLFEPEGPHRTACPGSAHTKLSQGAATLTWLKLKREFRFSKICHPFLSLFSPARFFGAAGGLSHTYSNTKYSDEMSSIANGYDLMQSSRL
jgi:hypothetical protein